MLITSHQEIIKLEVPQSAINQDLDPLIHQIILKNTLPLFHHFHHSLHQPVIE